MITFKCKMCGGDLHPEENATTCECEYCGSIQTIPTADSEKKMNLIGRAQRLLRACEFDKAAGVYESVVSEFPEEAEAYWGLVLSKYGIEYVDDPATGKKVPTCHRSSFDSVMDDPNFEQACENADGIARRVYRDEAKRIEELRKGIIEVSGKEVPYDIFICYKETDENGDRTLDSVLAQDIYNTLTEKGYRVFFSRITLEDKLGQEYEPYIFAALNSAKVMLAVGTDYEYYNAVWVKNEWSRFLKLIASGEKKTLIPCYKGIDAYDMPKEFARLQAQDMGKIGAMQDLIRGIEKIIPKKEKPVAEIRTIQTVVQNNGPTADSMLKRAFMALEDGDFSKADDFCEQALNIEPENGRAYLCKLLIELHVRRETDLKNQEQPFDQSKYYEKILRFGDEDLNRQVTDAIDFINHKEQKKVYDSACEMLTNAKSTDQVREAIRKFEFIPQFEGVDEKLRECNDKLEELLELFRTAHADWVEVCEAKRAQRERILAARVAKWREKLVGDIEHEHDKAIRIAQIQIESCENLKKKAEVELANLGILSFAAKKKQISHIKSLEQRIEGERIKIERAQAEYHRRKSDLERQVIELERKLRAEIEAEMPMPQEPKDTDDSAYYTEINSSVSAIRNNKDVCKQLEVRRKELADYAARISAGELHIVGLKSDGTVVAVGDNKEEVGQCDVGGWSDIVAITAGYARTVGLKSDGTLVAVGENDNGQCNVGGWSDIVAITAGYARTVGLKTDGRVVAVGYDYDGKYDVSNWSDIVAISAGSVHTVGLKSDGTVVAVGDNDHGQCDVSNWNLLN